jgi:hypothetical protein
VRDKFHGVWKGSRDAGIAVRRKYKNNTFAIRTFASAADFLAKGQCENHGFLLVNDFTPQSERHFPYPSFAMSPAQEIAALYKSLPQTSLMCADDIGVPKVFFRGHEPLVHFTQCRNCIVATNENEWLVHLRTLPGRVIPLDMRFGQNVLNYRWEYGKDVSIILGVGESKESLVIRLQQLVFDKPYSILNVLAVKGKNIEYVDTFPKLHAKAIETVFKHMTSLHVKNFKQVSTLEYEVQLPVGCGCCRTKNLCLQALASVLLVLDVMCGNVKLVSSSIDMVRGKLLQTDIVTANFGLRCKHDWTQGIPNLVFEAVVADHVEPDLMICYKSDAVFAKILECCDCFDNY